jgi:hypothetical protein
MGRNFKMGIFFGDHFEFCDSYRMASKIIKTLDFVLTRRNFSFEEVGIHLHSVF